MLYGSNARIGSGTGDNLKIDADRKGTGEISRLEIEKISIIRDKMLRQTMLRLAQTMLRLALVFLWILGSILFLALSSFAWHKTAPTTFHFLSAQQVESVQTFLLGSFITSFVLLSIRKLTK